SAGLHAGIFGGGRWGPSPQRCSSPATAIEASRKRLPRTLSFQRNRISTGPTTHGGAVRCLVDAWPTVRHNQCCLSVAYSVSRAVPVFIERFFAARCFPHPQLFHAG